ncbi:uncharacterized protein Bfra_001050 [Botrytis fragariae]|uniref:Uncharacterized protein n=1 Tax=Botrytis fragariae TaxID=1964551 RepID=A0A8H6ENQ7_9HELO|nr:uncharacterized protein Bfra_001050 [Botrytis fragariae]KAF5878879.1 hypothetical protein Bfra_001050 [Botrytis fragariae]
MNIQRQEEAEEKKNLNLEVSGTILMVVSINDGAERVIFNGIANIAQLANLVDDIGNAALTAYEILEDNSSATFSIKGILSGHF